MYAAVNKYLIGRKEVSIDDMLTTISVSPNASTRNEAGAILTELGWVKRGRKRINGKLKTIWSRTDSKDKVELDIMRLELMDRRQSQDVDTIAKLKEMGYSVDDTLKYLMMFYHAEIDRLDLNKEGEQEAKEFADEIIDIVGGKNQTIKMIWAVAYMFYIEKYYPELADYDKYTLENRKVYSLLMHGENQSTHHLEHRTITFSPNFIDMTIKLPDNGNDGEFKRYFIDKFISETTKNSLLDGGYDTKKLAALCLIARKHNQGLEFSYPYGVEKSWADTALAHVKDLSLKYG